MTMPAALDYFLAVFRNRSIGKAARELRISQPALSKAIRRLEDELRVPLFVRSPAGVEPTRFAEALSRRANVINDEYQRATAEIRSLRDNPAGEASIGVGPAIAASLLPEMLATFLARQPHVKVHVVEGLYESLSEAIMRSQIDLAITTRPTELISNDLTRELLFMDRFSFVCRADHPLAQRPHVSPADLLSAPWVLAPRTGLLWHRICDVFERHGLRPPEPRVETNSAGCMKTLLLSGQFLSLVPLHLISPEVQRGELVALNVLNVRIDRDVIVLRRNGSVLPPAAKALIDHIHDHVGHLAREGDGRISAGAYQSH